jgi:hypothetical protein
MATPQESITTVNGKRCTRSRARTSVPSIVTTAEPAVVTPTEVTPSTPADQAPAVQSSAAEAAPSPPPPPFSSAAAVPASPSSSAPAEQPAVAPAPASTQVAVSSTIGTISAVPPLSSTLAPPPVVASLVPSGQRAAGPKGQGEEANKLAAVPSQSAVATADASTDPAPTSSDAVPIAVISPSPNRSTRQASSFTAPGAAQSAILRSSAVVDPERSSQVGAPSISTSSKAPFAIRPTPPSTPAPALPSGDSASGVIGPESGGSDGGGGLIIPTSGDANLGSIVGGVVGGVAGLALVCALLFFCLRKRRTRRPRWVEKKAQGPRLVEKVRGIPAGLSIAFAKFKGVKEGLSRNQFQRHGQHDSISSIYSNDANGQAGFFAADAPVRRPSSRKSERNRLRKKNSSVSSQSTFTDITEEREAANPFDDPEPPRTLRLSNPDAIQSPHGPITPQPAMTPANPFISPYDDPTVPSGWPEVLPPVLGHKRTQSSISALSSHPPSQLLAGPTAPITRKPNGQQNALPIQKRRSSMAYPKFDATSTGASQESDFSLYDPGSSRPGTNRWTSGMRPNRTVRQSDPFDLDRPEVLGFGNVVGRKEVRASVTRPGQGRRTSSVGNWANTNEGPFSSFTSAARR